MVIQCNTSAHFTIAQVALFKAGYIWKAGNNTILEVKSFDEPAIITADINELTLTWSRLKSFSMAVSMAVTIAEATIKAKA